MKYLLPLIILWLQVLTTGAQTFRIEATLTLTNNPAESNALVLNGDTRLWLTNATAGTNHISIGASTAASATNLYGHLAVRPPSNNVFYAWQSSTSVVFYAPLGSNLTVTTTVPIGASNWASITYRTNAVQAPATPIVMPFDAAMSVTTRSNAMTALLSNLWKYAAYGLLPVTPAQIAATYAPLTTPTVADMLTVSGTAPAFWLGDSGWFGWGLLTDPNDYALIITNDMGGTTPQWFTSRPGTPYSLATWLDLTNSFAALFAAQELGEGIARTNNPILWWDRDANGGFRMQAVQDGLAFIWQDGEVGLFETNLIFGPLGFPTVFPHDVSMAGNTYLANATATNLSATSATLATATIGGGTATNVNAALLATTLLPRAATSLVNGNNAGINAGTNTYLRLSGATTIASLAGFTAQADGALRLVQISGSVTNLILNDSGVDGTAANRILTGTGADLALTNQPSFLQLIYDGASARWRVIQASR